MIRSLFFLLFLLFISCNDHHKSDNSHNEIPHEEMTEIQPVDLIGKTIEYKYGESIYLLLIP